MQDNEKLLNSIRKYIHTPPTTALEAVECSAYIYANMPDVVGSIDRPTICALLNSLLTQLLSNYVLFSERMKIEDFGVSSAAMNIFILCSTLHLISGGDCSVSSSQFAIDHGLVHTKNPKQTLKELHDTVWLVNMRWPRLRIYRPDDVSQLETYIRSLLHRAFYMTQVKLSRDEIGGTGLESDMYEDVGEGRFCASIKSIRRLCEGICRLLCTLRFLLWTSNPIFAPSKTAAEYDLLSDYLSTRAKEVVVINGFRNELRDMIEVMSIVPLDYAKYVEKALTEKNVPHMLLIHSRPSEFSANRANFTESVNSIALTKISERDGFYDDWTVCERFGSFAVKLSTIHMIFNSVNVSVIGDYFVAEPYLIETQRDLELTIDPCFLMIMGRIHVVHEGKTILCPDGIDQAIIVWLTIIKTKEKGKGKLGSIKVTEQIDSILSHFDQTVSKGPAWSRSIKIV